jgi:hypothetical protein
MQIFEGRPTAPKSPNDALPELTSWSILSDENRTRLPPCPPSKHVKPPITTTQHSSSVYLFCLSICLPVIDDPHPPRGAGALMMVLAESSWSVPLGMAERNESNESICLSVSQWARLPQCLLPRLSIYLSFPFPRKMPPPFLSLSASVSLSLSLSHGRFLKYYFSNRGVKRAAVS